MAEKPNNKKLPDVDSQIAFMSVSPREQINRQKFSNYVPEGNQEYKPTYQSKYDTSMDRPMVFLGMGSGQREVSTELVREMMDKYPQFFRDIDQSNYPKLQSSLQAAYRAGSLGPAILDNLVLRSNGMDPISGMPLMAGN